MCEPCYDYINNIDKTFCQACLSVDRKLSTLGEYHDIYRNISNISSNMLSKPVYLCWECMAVLRKIKLFKANVEEAHKMLTDHCVNKQSLHSLSNLTKAVVGMLTVSPNSTVTSQTVINYSSSELNTTKHEHFNIVEIKTEEIDTSDYCEPKQEHVSEDNDDSEDNEEDKLIIPEHVSEICTVVNNDTNIVSNDDPLLPVQNKIEVQVDFNSPIQHDAPIKDQNPFTPEMISFNNVYVHIPKTKSITVKKNTKGVAKVTVAVPKVVKNSKGETKLGINDIDDDGVVSKTLSREEMLKFREVKRSHHNFRGVRYRCGRCLEKFTSQEDLDTHNKKHDAEHGEFVCDVCEQRFTNSAERDLDYHAHFLVYECPTCGFQSHERKQVSDHKRKRHQISEFVCRTCNAVFKTYSEQRKHRLKEHYEKPTCTECGKEFCSRSSFKSHMSKHTGQLEECKVCKKKVTALGLKSHMKTHENNPDEMMYCAECGTTYKNKVCYSIHLKTSLKHNTIEQLGFKCEYCSKSFAYKYTLLDHIDIEHTKAGDCVCDICSKEFKTKRRLARHLRVNHSGKKSIKNRMCEICGKSFTNRTSLNHHINSHLGHRPFKCQDCGDTFSYSASLYTHRRLVHKVKRKRERQDD